METLKRASEALARPKTGLIAILSFVAFFFLLFCAVDNRPPDDHDDFYTANSTWALDDSGAAIEDGKLVEGCTRSWSSWRSSGWWWKPT